ncbi:uncharacterized protein PGTG_15322 [Puccinia graminis f. sp. tritici CRL 75-36-700-3]|uniref:Uncharacterized protein n=1 Tax=Puccinia graminis f. sp. tritici (strain CRL 75-36-700-3 / race SCCL) TaxID=418459 RepID=E3KYT4_PUCGT|nr:uncharacterized protein PGTG_15322 [Puccinia graminis f. sp. tritici CRL 75-36-700-3]EFP89480.2 hypothetical protein PGTG_15322 [Puccinia graminis f. sp. tritici CRL 75-36-700-3]
MASAAGDAFWYDKPYAELLGLAGRLLSRIGDCCGTIKAKMILTVSGSKP